MSKRFVLQAPKEEIETFFSAEANTGHHIEPNYNVSAGALQPIIVEKDGERKVKKAKWGLIPPDADSEREGKDHCIFKIEDAKENEWPGTLIAKQRALIPANGFYKWKTTEHTSNPFYVRMLSGNLMALAGLYSRWKSASGREIYSFGMLTAEANTLVEPIGDRMPIIIRPESFGQWLNENVSIDEILEEVEAYPTMLTEMIVNRVSEDVNDINNNEPGLIQPIPK